MVLWHRLVCALRGHRWPRNAYHPAIYHSCQRCGLSYKVYLSRKG
jgi:hypothetical protein